MNTRTYYKKGSWNVICDRCSAKRKREEVGLEWTGFLVCLDTCLEPRHPMDLLKVTPDYQAVPIARPRTYPSELESPAFDPNTQNP